MQHASANLDFYKTGESITFAKRMSTWILATIVVEWALIGLAIPVYSHSTLVLSRYLTHVMFGILLGLAYGIPLGYAAAWSAENERLTCGNDGIVWRRVLRKRMAIPWARIDGVTLRTTRHGTPIGMVVTDGRNNRISVVHYENLQELFNIVCDNTSVIPKTKTVFDWNSTAGFIVIAITGTLAIICIAIVSI